MPFTRTKTKPRRRKPATRASPGLREPDKCRDRLSKYLRYDTEVPGDRGDCTDRSLCEGSE
jgi:hypothetical protein